MARPIIIDTDTGVDDALALILALRSPEVSVKAITTVAGNVEVDKCTRNVTHILDLLQLVSRPLLAEGSWRPLKRKLVTAPEVHGRDGLGNMGLKRPAKLRIRHDAVDVILHCCRQFGKRLTIVALGPLTNLAKAARKNLRTLKMAGRIVSMGGALRVPGNTGPVAEFNYFVDPEAAQLVLNAGLKVTVVPLDLTQQVVVMRREIEYRAKRRASKLADFILRSTRHYMRYHMAVEGFDGGYLHDPIAVACVIHPSLIQTARNRIDVETKGELTRGMTVAGIQRSGKVDVAIRIDREGFLKLFHERLWQ